MSNCVNKVLDRFEYIYNDLSVEIEERTYDIVYECDLKALALVYDEVVQMDEKWNMWYVSMSAIEEIIAKKLAQKIESLVDSIECNKIVYLKNDEDISFVANTLRKHFFNKPRMINTFEFGITIESKKISMRCYSQFKSFLNVLFESDKKLYKVTKENNRDKLEYIGEAKDFAICAVPNDKTTEIKIVKKEYAQAQNNIVFSLSQFIDINDVVVGDDQN